VCEKVENGCSPSQSVDKCIPDRIRKVYNTIHWLPFCNGTYAATQEDLEDVNVQGTVANVLKSAEHQMSL
jgi:hypothetical protein